MATVKFPNFCIYCGVQNVKLTDEHIIPEGFGGNQIFRKSSCEKCCKLTLKIEGRILRNGGLREVRSVLGIGKRRKEEKPKDAMIEVKMESERKQRVVPLEQHPLVFSLPLFETPTLLSGRKLPNAIRVRAYHYYSANQSPFEVCKNLGETEIYGKSRNYDNDFGKFLAKVAWSSWVSERGVQHLLNPWLPDIITGIDPVIGNCVGICDYAVAGHISPPCLHAIHHAIWEHQGKYLVVAHIQLFLQITPCPTYIVCIGYLKNGITFDAVFKNWHCPTNGIIGQPLKVKIPQYICTTFFGKQGDGKAEDILEELRKLNLAPKQSS